MKTKTLKEHRAYLGKVILWTAILIALSVLLINLLGGLLPSELDKVINLLLPINALYVGTVFKYAVANPFKTPTTDADATNTEDKELNEMYISTSKFLVFGHLLVIVAVLWLDGFNLITFSQSMNTLRVVESAFGLYSGLYLSHIFGGQKD